MKPLTPSDCDLRNFPYMPLDVVRLRDSDLSAMESPEACWAAVLLWCASWHQIPAASLPDDDRVLANLAGFGRVVKEWKKVREGALRGWILCDDGRLYHPVIAEKALTSLESKYKREWKTECARIDKHNQRHPQDLINRPDYEEWMSSKTDNNCPAGQDADVPKTSNTKSTPTETETETETETDITEVINIEGDSNVSSVDDSFPLAPKAEICIALTKIGLPPFNASNPKFIALVESGATVEEFVNTAQEIKSKDQSKFNFDYIIGVVAGRRKDVKQMDVHKGAMPIKFSNPREEGRHIAARSIFTPESTRHLQQVKSTEIEVYDEQKQVTA